MRAHPIQVAARTAGDEAVGKRFFCTLDGGDRRKVQFRGHPGCPAHFVQMPQQTEAGDIRGRLCARRQRGLRSFAVEGGHGINSCLGNLPGGFVLVIENAHADRLGQRDGQTGLGGVVTHEFFWCDNAGGSHAVHRFRSGDRVPTGDRNSCLGGHVHPAAQDFAQHVQAEYVVGPAHQVDRGHRGTTHGVDIGKRIGGCHPAPVIRVVEHGGEKVRGGDHGQPVLDFYGCGIVAVVQTDQHVGVGFADEARDGRFQLAGRDFAGAATSGGKRGEVDVIVSSFVTHSPMLPVRRRCTGVLVILLPTPPPCTCALVN